MTAMKVSSAKGWKNTAINFRSIWLLQPKGLSFQVSGLGSIEDIYTDWQDASTRLFVETFLKLAEQNFVDYVKIHVSFRHGGAGFVHFFSI